MVKILIALLLTTATAMAQHPLDTIRVQRLVVDTSSNLSVPFPRPARLVSLLEVREQHDDKEGNPYWSDCMNCKWGYNHKHLRYLTSFRTPIPFGWVVFEGTFLQEADPVPPPHEWPLAPADSVRLIIIDSDTLGIRVVGDLGGTMTPDTIGWPVPHFTTLTVGGLPHWADLESKDTYVWLPRRLRKRYLKYLKTHPHE